MKIVRVFYWESVDALAKYRDGKVVSICEHKAAAVELAVEAFAEFLYSKDEPHVTEKTDALRFELLKKEPVVYERPISFILWAE